jgi:hypothetical protein
MMDQQLHPRRRTWLGLAASTLLLAACTQEGLPTTPAPTTAPTTPGQSVLDAPSPKPTTAPTATPTPAPKRFFTDFEQAALGAVPADFIDVTAEEATPSWVYKGNWAVTQDEAGNRVLMHDDVRQQPAVSFQRYRGDALGKPNGQVPDVFYSEVAVRPIRSPHNYTPIGDQGIQFYYLSYNTYLEVIIKPTHFEIWEARQAAPETSKGWKRLFAQAMTFKAGETRKLGALVDTRAGTFQAFLDGKAIGTVKSDLLKPAQPAWVALRGIGNVVSFDNLLIEPR